MHVYAAVKLSTCLENTKTMRGRSLMMSNFEVERDVMQPFQEGYMTHSMSQEAYWLYIPLP